MEKLNNFVAKDLSLSDQGDTMHTFKYGYTVCKENNIEERAKR